MLRVLRVLGGAGVRVLLRARAVSAAAPLLRTMTSAELAADTVADRLRSEETRASVLDALEATPAPIPHELALAVAPALVDVASDTQDREAFDRCGLLVGRLMAEAAPDPSAVFGAAFGEGRGAAWHQRVRST